MNTSASELENTYQRALSAYPRRWREEQGDEFIGVLLDVARSEHRSAPTASELLNIVGSGLIARAMHLLGRVSRTRRSVLAFTATVLTFYLAVTMMLLGEWGPWVRPGTLRWRPTGAPVRNEKTNHGNTTTAAKIMPMPAGPKSSVGDPGSNATKKTETPAESRRCSFFPASQFFLIHHTPEHTGAGCAFSCRKTTSYELFRTADNRDFRRAA